MTPSQVLQPTWPEGRLVVSHGSLVWAEQVNRGVWLGERAHGARR